MNKYRFACLVSVVLIGFALSGTARADSFTYDSIVFTGAVTGTTATLTIQCTNADGTQQGGGKGFAVSNDLSSSSVTAVPETGTFTLLTAGLFATGLLSRRARLP